MNKEKLQLRMLGTGHATVTKCYNTCFVLQKNLVLMHTEAGKNFFQVICLYLMMGSVL